jgi:DNA-binding transcriptional LysR family regulator
VKPQVVARAFNEEWAVALVTAGVGAALVPEGSVRNHDDVVVREIEQFDLVRRVGLAFDPGRTPSTALQTVIGLVAPEKVVRFSARRT